MKAEVRAIKPKRNAAGKTRRAVVRLPKKSHPWRGFAPELCGVMSGPSDLSTREGFARG